MIKTRVATIDGDPITFIQCNTIEEAKKEGLPEGLYHYWEQNGKRMYAPFEILTKINESVEEGTFKPEHIASQTDIKGHYRKLMEAQKSMVNEQMKGIREDYVKSGAHPEIVRQFDTIADVYDNIPTPDEDGVSRPTREQANKMMGGKLNEMYTEDQIETLFNGR